VPAPALEPPFDADHPPRLPRQTRQAPLPLSFDVPADLLSPPATSHAGPVAPGADEPHADDPGRWSATFAQALAETLTGVRPAAQLGAWTTRPVQGLVERRAILSRAATAGDRSVRREASRARLGRLHICRPNPTAVETTVALHCAGRTRALAFRLEARDGRWVCTALELG
jgi:hypothetical protein